MWMYIIYGSGKSPVSWPWVTPKEVRWKIGKVIQTCVGLNCEFTSCLLDQRLREPIGGSVSLMGDNRFINLFSKICNFLIVIYDWKWIWRMTRHAFHWFIICLLSILYSLLLLILPLQMKRGNLWWWDIQAHDLKLKKVTGEIHDTNKFRV